MRVFKRTAAAKRNKTVSLSSKFCELVGDHNISNETLGRITRCLILGTDEYLTMDIVPDVSLLREGLEAREFTRCRVAKYRNRKAGLPIDGDSSSNEKSPFKDTKKLPPIVPLEEPLESSPEKKRRTDNAPAVTAKARKIDEGAVSQCLFDFAGESLVRNAPRASVAAPAARSATMGASPPVPAPDASEGRSGASDATLMADKAWRDRCFANFWAWYPRKVAKAAALKAFAKVMASQSNPGKFMGMVRRSLEWWKGRPEWRKDGGKYIPYPATWLNAGHWADAEEAQGGADSWLSGDEESDMDLIRRMAGG